MSKKTKIIIGVSILCIAAVGFWYFFKVKSHENAAKGTVQKTSEEVTVTLTATGFSPAEVTIHVGGTVKFVTNNGKPFWPASDPHPTHQIEPAFDPRKPVEPEASWSYTFPRAGDFKYHDHLFFTHTGIVHVLGNQPAASAGDVCKATQNSNDCWNEQIETALKDKGLDAAFDVLADLYANNKDFAEYCHSNAHTLGQAAYELYSQGKPVNLTPKANYCGYGFYHGFMETLLQTSGNIQEARDFCAGVGRQLSAQTIDAEGACYHGIGHGTVDGSDPTAWGNVDKMLAPGIQMCNKVAAEDHSRFGKLYRCMTGAYNALEILSQDPKYKLTEISGQDPFAICPRQPAEFYEACYTNMLPALLRFTNSDFKKSAEYVEKTSMTLEDKSQVMLGLFDEYMRLHLKDGDYVSNALALCRGLSSSMRLPCIEGLSDGHMKYGEPTKEYEKGLAFCGNSLLKSDESEVCYQYILPRLRIWYSSDKTAQVCSGVPEKFRSYCPPAA